MCSRACIEVCIADCVLQSVYSRMCIPDCIEQNVYNRLCASGHSCATECVQRAVYRRLCRGGFVLHMCTGDSVVQNVHYQMAYSTMYSTE